MLNRSTLRAALADVPAICIPAVAFSLLFSSIPLHLAVGNFNLGLVGIIPAVIWSVLYTSSKASRAKVRARLEAELRAELAKRANRK